MNGYEDRLYVGNIMQRTLIETGSHGFNEFKGNDFLFLRKENAVLFKTSSGVFVEADKIKLNGLFSNLKIKSLDKLEAKDLSYDFGDITVMPASDLNNQFIYGWFVDKNTLVPYNEFMQNNQSSIHL